MSETSSGRPLFVVCALIYMGRSSVYAHQHSRYTGITSLEVIFCRPTPNNSQVYYSKTSTCGVRIMPVTLCVMINAPFETNLYG